MTAVEMARRWSFALVVLCLAIAGSWRAVSRAPADREPMLAAARTIHRPAPGSTDAVLRDPFVTGAEWRARLRETFQPPVSPSPSGPPRVVRSVAPPPVDPYPVLLGTMISGRDKFAVLSGGYFPEGSVVGGYRVETVDLDQVVFSNRGKRIVVKVPDRTPGSGP
jgi:hypothetical protein